MISCSQTSPLQVPESERPIYDFEFTSSMFELSSDRQLVVRTESLDRDSPNQPVLTLQVRDKKQSQEKIDFNARENSNGFVMRWSEICNLDNVQRPLHVSVSPGGTRIPLGSLPSDLTK